VVEGLDLKLAGAQLGRADPVLAVDTVMFLLGLSIGFIGGYMTAAVLVSERVATIRDQKADDQDMSMDQ